MADGEVKKEEVIVAAEPVAAAVSDPVTARLNELGVTETIIIEKVREQGFKTLDLLEEIELADLTDAGLDKARARKLIKKLKASIAEPVTPAATSIAANAMSAIQIDNILPPVMQDESILAALKAGGVLKVETPAVVSAVRAALAYRVGLYKIPDTLVKRMEEYADTAEEQVGPEFFALCEEITRRDYAAIFSAIPGLTGKYVTNARKEMFFKRIDSDLWPAIINFVDALKTWQGAYLQGLTGPMAELRIVALLSGGAGGMPAGMMAPPDTGAVRDAADEVANAINRVFKGTGVPIASALGYDAKRIKDILVKPDLPKMVGAANRDMMLKMLNVAVPSTYPRLEQSIIQLVLGILQLKDQPAGQTEIQYLTALYMLGSQIQWNLIDRNLEYGVTGIGGDDRSPFGRGKPKNRET